MQSRRTFIASVGACTALSGCTTESSDDGDDEPFESDAIADLRRTYHPEPELLWSDQEYTASGEQFHCRIRNDGHEGDVTAYLLGLDDHVDDIYEDPDNSTTKGSTTRRFERRERRTLTVREELPQTYDSWTFAPVIASYTVEIRNAGDTDPILVRLRDDDEDGEVLAETETVIEGGEVETVELEGPFGTREPTGLWTREIYVDLIS